MKEVRRNHYGNVIPIYLVCDPEQAPHAHRQASYTLRIRMTHLLEVIRP